MAVSKSVRLTELSAGWVDLGSIPFDDLEVISLTNGGFAVTYEIGGSAFSSVLDANFQSTFLGRGGQFAGELVQLSNGNIVLTYQDGDQVAFRVVTESGVEVVPLTELGDTNSSMASITALSTGGFAIATQDLFVLPDGDIDIRTFSAAGVQQASVTVDSSGSADRDPDIVELDNGDLAVAWHRIIAGTPETTEVWHAIYNPDLSVQTAAFLDDTIGDLNQRVELSAVTGGYVAVYEDSGWQSDPNDLDITLARYNSAGSYLQEFNVSDLSAFGPDFADYQNARDPEVITIEGTEVLVSFTVDGPGGQTDTILSYMDAAGGPVNSSVPLVLTGSQPQEDDATDPVSALLSSGLILAMQNNVGNFRPSNSFVGLGLVLESDSDGDTLVGTAFSDDLSGNGGDDTIVGLAGNDSLFGGTGSDDLEGGTGNDLMEGGGDFDQLEAQDGDDTVFGQGDEDLLFGGAGNDTMYGGTDNDELSGEDDNDILFGDGGDDFLEGNTGRDTLFGGQGDDRLFAETINATTTETDFNGLFGGAGNDTLEGSNGGDLLNGGTGNDTMEGGLGNDFYFVDSVDDLIVGEIAFSQGGGIDTVRTFIDYTQPTNIELVRLGNLTDTDNLDATGNDAPGTLVGNAGNNELIGRGGNDQINGNGGADRLTGNTGRDTLVGGAGADTFLYSSISESRAGAANRDVINGFDRGADRIDLSAMDANLGGPGEGAFTFLGTGRFTGTAGELRLQGLGGANAVLVEGDVRGDGVADFQIFVNLTTVLSASDFIL